MTAEPVRAPLTADDIDEGTILLIRPGADQYHPACAYLLPVSHKRRGNCDWVEVEGRPSPLEGEEVTVPTTVNWRVALVMVDDLEIWEG